MESEIESTPSQCPSILAAIYKSGGLGAAIFDGSTGLIRIMEDLRSYSSGAMLEQMIYESCSSVLLSTTSTSCEIIERIQQMTMVNIRPSCEFKADRGILAISRFEQNFKEATKDKSGLSLMCVGALQKYLNENDLADKVLGIDWCSYSCFMMIDKSALEALEIFSFEDHPNRHFSDRKDGFSIFRLMNRTRSNGGGKLLRNWCMRPLQRIEEIKGRQELIGFFLRPSYESLIKDVSLHLSKVPNIKHTLALIKRAPTSAAFMALLNFLRSIMMLIDELQPCLEHPFLAKFLSVDRNTVSALIDAIVEIVDFEESKVANRVVVKPRLNRELDDLRAFYAGLPDFLSISAKEISGRFTKSNISSISLVYFPQIGFLLAIPITDFCTAEEVSSIDGLSVQFATEKFVYVKEEKTRELDSSIGDIHSDIVDKELEIIVGLQQEITKYDHELTKYADWCFELDCILSLALFAKEYDLVKPEIVEEPLIEVKQGRHLLAEQVTETFIPNDCSLDSVTVLTGPNSSGKSVFMKQVGLIVFLAHIGSFVPAAEGTTIGITDKILCRINTKESISKNQSAFSTDLHQVSSIMDEVTKQSLVLIDEFGKGTSSSDGIALFASLLKWLAQRGSPRTLAITHFHEIHRQQLIPLELVNWWSMSCHWMGDSECFLYKVEKTACTESYGPTCAKLAGLPESMITRAALLKEMYESQVPPEELRFAQMDPELDRANMELIRSLLS